MLARGYLDAPSHFNLISLLFMRGVIKGNSMLISNIKIVIASLLSLVSMLVLASEKQSLDNDETITRVAIFQGDSNIYSYITSDKYEAVAAHLLEGPEGLILIDTGFGGGLTGAIKSEIALINKPLLGILLSHDHPDHTSGLSDYEGIATYATRNVKEQLIKGPFKINKKLAASVNVLELGDNTLAGLSFKVQEFEQAEATYNTVFSFPKLNTMAVGDLVFHNVYLYPGVDRIKWQQALMTLREENKQSLILAGHGLHTTSGEFTTVINYLKHFDQLLENSKNHKSLIKKLVREYPHYAGGEVALDLQKYAFPQ